MWSEITSCACFFVNQISVVLPGFIKTEQTLSTLDVRVSEKFQDDRNKNWRERDSEWEEADRANKNWGNKKSAVFPSERQFPPRRGKPYCVSAGCWLGREAERSLPAAPLYQTFICPLWLPHNPDTLQHTATSKSAPQSWGNVFIIQYKAVQFLEEQRKLLMMTSLCINKYL